MIMRKTARLEPKPQMSAAFYPAIFSRKSPTIKIFIGHEPVHKLVVYKPVVLKPTCRSRTYYQQTCRLRKPRQQICCPQYIIYNYASHGIC
jgi:hypothetical protein